MRLLPLRAARKATGLLAACTLIALMGAATACGYGGTFIGKNSLLTQNPGMVTAIAISSVDGSVFIAKESDHEFVEFHHVIKVSSDGSEVEVFAGGNRSGRKIDSESATNTRLDEPSALAISPDGAWVYIAEKENHRVLKVKTDGSDVKVFAGRDQGNAIDAGSAANTELNEPSALAISPDGEWVYIAESENHRVLKVKADGSDVKQFAGGVRGNAIDAGSANNTELNGPSALAISPDGVFIAESENHRVLKVKADGSAVELFVGSGVPGNAIDAGSASNTELNGPSALVISPDGGSVYICERGNHRVLKARADGSAVELFAGSDDDEHGIGFPNALGISADGHSVFIGGREGALKVSADGNSGKAFVGLGREPIVPNSAARTALATPSALAISPDGEWVYIAESENHRVLKVKADGSAVELFSGSGVQGNVIDAGSATNTDLNTPSALAISPDGKWVFIAVEKSHRVLKVKADGSAVELFAGSGVSGDAIDAGSAANTGLNGPSALAISPDGKWVFIAEVVNDRVLRVKADGSAVELFAGNGVSGDAIDAGSAANTELHGPNALAVSPDGKWVFIAESENHRVLKVKADGSAVELFAGSGDEGHDIAANSAAETAIGYPQALAISADGHSVFIGGYGPVLKVSADGTAVVDLLGDRVAGTTAIALSPDGQTVFVADDWQSVLFIGGDDPYEEGLKGLVERGVKAAGEGDKRELKKSLYDLTLLATDNPACFVQRSPTEGGGRRVLATDPKERARRKKFLAENVYFKTLPEDVKIRIIADDVDGSPEAPIYRLRAKLALSELKSQAHKEIRKRKTSRIQLSECWSPSVQPSECWLQSEFEIPDLELGGWEEWDPMLDCLEVPGDTKQLSGKKRDRTKGDNYLSNKANKDRNNTTSDSEEDVDQDGLRLMDLSD